MADFAFNPKYKLAHRYSEQHGDGWSSHSYDIKHGDKGVGYVMVQTHKQRPGLIVEDVNTDHPLGVKGGLQISRQLKQLHPHAEYAEGARISGARGKSNVSDAPEIKVKLR